MAAVETFLSRLFRFLMHDTWLIHSMSGKCRTVEDSKGKAQKVNRAAPNAPSVIYDAVVVLGGASSAELTTSGPRAVHSLNEAYRHGKPIAFLSGGNALLSAIKRFLRGQRSSSEIYRRCEKASFSTACNQECPRLNAEQYTAA